MTTSANTSFTAFSTKDLIEKRGKLAVLTKDAVADTAPLRAKIAKIFDQEFIEAIAAEYRKGWILNSGTTNLDTGWPVIWSISRIAISGAPNALDLIHDVILASIPSACARSPRSSGPRALVTSTVSTSRRS